MNVQIRERWSSWPLSLVNDLVRYTQGYEIQINCYTGYFRFLCLPVYRYPEQKCLSDILYKFIYLI